MLTIKNDDELTIMDFVHNKKVKPFKDWRTVSKAINFQLMFGASALSFSSYLKLKTDFSEKDCDDYISLIGLHKELRETILAQSKSKYPMSEEDCKYLVCATKMRETFFNTYKGFDERIPRERKYAIKNGYNQNWQGPVRHMPELRYMNISKDLELVGADKNLYQGMFHHLMNNACNTTIQAMESRIAFAAWYNISKYISLWGLKSYCWNNVHDSLDFYVYKPEAELILALANACANYDRDPVYGIHMSFDGEMADIQDDAHRENTFYKHGEELSAVPIDVAIQHYNERNGTDIRYLGCDWLYDPWYETRDKEYNKYVEKYGSEYVDNVIKFFEGPAMKKACVSVNKQPQTRRMIIGD